MYKIIKNANFDASKATADKKGLYLFDKGDGSAPIELVVWLEVAKKNDKHPEGKPHIILPKGNPTNRSYFSEDKFNNEAVNDEVVVEIKTAPARVLGSSGVKQQVIKYLNEEDAKEYTAIVTKGVEAYKAVKGTSKKKKPEEMNKEELEAYIEALKTGTSFKASTTGPKSFLEMLSEDEYARYNELLALSVENKANAPKAARKPLTDEEKAARKANREKKELSKAEKLLAALINPSAAPSEETEDEVDDEDIDDEDIDDEDVDTDEVDDEDEE